MSSSAFSKPSIRLNKYISESGVCSRREADRFIEQGNVYINGARAQVGDQVAPGDLVKVNGQQIEPWDEEQLVFIALNKPVGIVSTTEAAERDNVVDFVGHSKRIFPIGRLDKDSQGLIFLTNNGDLVNKILRAGNGHDKEYIVTVNKPVTDEFIKGMAGGVPMLGTRTKKCTVERITSNSFRIVLVQGLNRQIRRMCEHFNFQVLKLERVKIMNVTLKGLAIGDWRDLTEKELHEISKLIEHSSSEAAPGTKSQTKKSSQGKKNHQRHSGADSSARQRSSDGSSREGGRSEKSGQGKGRGGRSKAGNASDSRSRSNTGGRSGQGKPAHGKSGQGKPASRPAKNKSRKPTKPRAGR
ncbi:23S rRNA pseudouridine(2604) synthase RluF [Endozoicomonas sp. OPT23]|uniref:23S rRNA pseudouridine(2604) synthase RluF n=1 Tax=Endozoicomonas sp. OPT23 TaxID=2072845 RepID=UPI00129AC6B0|nr:23S rRNA pseudouridine(2604) synthase RluF [Endozoicomonas sp. OPT23]MRI34895.1 23S rRNA pseudouridine(2604) synthase RluF [Endozoicomonas sp. OPT23]